MEHYFGSVMSWLIPVIIILSVWELVWKYIAMWKASRNNHLAWYICIAVLNTAGILPIVYLLLHRSKSDTIAT